MPFLLDSLSHLVFWSSMTFISFLITFTALAEDHHIHLTMMVRHGFGAKVLSRALFWVLLFAVITPAIFQPKFMGEGSQEDKVELSSRFFNGFKAKIPKIGEHVKAMQKIDDKKGPRC